MNNDGLTLQELFLRGEEQLKIREEEEKKTQAAKKAYEISRNKTYWEAVLLFLRSEIPPCLLPYMRIGSNTEADMRKNYPPRLSNWANVHVHFEIPKLKVWIGVEVSIKNEPGYQLDINFDPTTEAKWVIETYNQNREVIPLCYETKVEVALALAKRYDKQLREKSKSKESEEKDSGSDSNVTPSQSN